MPVDMMRVVSTQRFDSSQVSIAFRKAMSPPLVLGQPLVVASPGVLSSPWPAT